MKNILTWITAAAFLINACTNQENPADLFNKVYTPDHLPKATFAIRADRDTVLHGKSGTKIQIYKNTFVDKNGQPVVGSVDIDLKEAFTTYDMVIGNLTTTSDGKMLQSGGMIYINASAGGQPVDIAKDKFLGVALPTTRVQKGMQVFEGVVTNNGINWVAPKNTLNAQIKAAIAPAKKDNSPVENRHEGVDEIGAILEYIGPDTFGGEVETPEPQKKKARPQQDPQEDLQEETIFVQEFRGNINFSKEDVRTNYIFALKKLGWANIDRLYSDPRTKEVELITNIENYKDFEMVYVTMIISQMYLPGYQRADATFSFTHDDLEKPGLPVGETATILATAYKNGNPYFAIKKITITEKQTVSFTLNETTMDNLKSKLQEISG